MEGFENAMSVIDYIVDTNRKRHMVGGMLLSISMLFGGLAFTVMTVKNDKPIQNS